MSNDSTRSRNTIANSGGRSISDAAINAMQEASLRIQPPAAAERMWQRLFTEEDRQHFDRDLEASWPDQGTVGMWRQVRRGSAESAVIEIAFGLNLMSQSDADWLRREFGLESPQSTPPADRPDWRSDVGELWFQGHIIRRVRVMREPSNICRIFSAFQAAEWSRRVDNPLSRGQQQLHDTVLFLNEALESIRFRVQEGGGALTWEQV